MCSDRIGDEHIDLTHELLAIILGARRAGVTVALQTLEQQGAIARRRGRLRIVNRTTLLTVAGASYGPAEAEDRQLIPRLNQLK